MKPINLRNNDNNIPTSSNCVMLESLGIDCSVIENKDLGATITNMLEQMVYLFDTFNIKTYDIKCFAADCKEETFIKVFQLLMDAICTLAPDEIITVCNSCMLNIDNCLIKDNVNIENYIVIIGEKICELQQSIIALDNQVMNQEERITILENTDFLEIPFGPVEAVCSLNPQTTDIVTLTKAFDKMFCLFAEFHGDPSLIDGKLELNCDIFNGGNPPNNEPNTYASTLSLLWQATCQLRSEVVILKANCCAGSSTGCDGENFVLVFSRTESNEVNIDVTGSVSAGYLEQSLVTVTDVNGLVYSDNVYFGNYSGSTFVMIIPNTLDLSSEFIVTADITTLNLSSSEECVSSYTETVYYIVCPVISSEIVTYNEINFLLVYNGSVSTDYIITLTDGTSTFTQNETLSSTGSTPIVFSNLDPETDYTLAVTTLDGSGNDLICEEKNYTTPPAPCSEAINLDIDGKV